MSTRVTSQKVKKRFVRRSEQPDFLPKGFNARLNSLGASRGKANTKPTYPNHIMALTKGSARKSLRREKYRIVFESLLHWYQNASPVLPSGIASKFVSGTLPLSMMISSVNTVWEGIGDFFTQDKMLVFHS